MAFRKPRFTNPKESAVEMAIAAVEGQPSVMDMPMGVFDPSPTALGLDDAGSEMCFNPRCSRHAVDKCKACGQPLSEECVDEDED